MYLNQTNKCTVCFLSNYLDINNDCHLELYQLKAAIYVDVLRASYKPSTPHTLYSSQVIVFLFTNATTTQRRMMSNWDFQQNLAWVHFINY